MKKVKILVVLMACAACVSAQELKTKQDSVGYAWGIVNGEQFFLNQLDFFSVDAFLEGFKTGFLGNASTSKIQEPQRTELLNTFQEMAQQKQQEVAERDASFNKFVGKDIMEKNLKEDKEVVQTASGLQYKVLVQGLGSKPMASDRVKVHYTGTFYDGRVFDSSVQRGEPIVFPLNGVIKGWTEGLQLMPVGSKYKFWIPADLAYGNNPVGNIPKSAGSMLIFEVELFEINPQ